MALAEAQPEKSNSDEIQRDDREIEFVEAHLRCEKVSLDNFARHHSCGIVWLRGAGHQPQGLVAVVAHGMRAAGGDQHEHACAALEGVLMKRGVSPFVPVQRPARAWQKNKRLALADVIVIAANRAGQRGGQMHVGNAAEKVERLCRKREPITALISGIAQLRYLEFHDATFIITVLWRLHE